MESQASVAKGYILTPFHFMEQTSHGNIIWRQTQVSRVLAFFEEVKKRMSEDGTAMVYHYLKDGKWIHDGVCPSDHPVYKHFMGRKRDGSGTPTLFYPAFLVIQALFGVGVDKVLDSVKRVCTMMSEHWGVNITPEKPFYPHLEDSVKEHTLMLGRLAISQEETEKSLPSLSPGIQAEHLKTALDKAKWIQHHSKARQELYAEIQSLKAEGYELVQNIRQKEALAQDRSDVIAELNNTLFEHLKDANKRSPVHLPDVERSNKRLREN